MKPVHDYPACGVFRDGKCSCDAFDTIATKPPDHHSDADRHDTPDDVEVMYLVWPHDRHGGWQDATKERYDWTASDDRMAVVSLESYLAKELRNTRKLPVVSEETTLSKCIAELVEKHGSLRAAALAVNIEVGYLSRLAAGEKVNPSKEFLRRLGLRRVVSYERIEKVSAIKESTSCGYCTYEESDGYLIEQCQKCKAADS
jgi:hypothetical protein